MANNSTAEFEVTTIPCGEITEETVISPIAAPPPPPAEGIMEPGKRQRLHFKRERFEFNRKRLPILEAAHTQFFAEMAADDPDSAMVRAAAKTSDKLRKAARDRGIGLNASPEWIPAKALFPYAAQLTGHFNKLSFSPAYLEWQAERTDKLVNALCRWDGFLRAAESWPTLSDAEYKTFAMQIGRRQRQIFCKDIITPPDIDTGVYKEARRDPSPAYRYVRGTHGAPLLARNSPHSINYNIHPDTDFHVAATGLDVIHHETLHAIQSGLAKAFTLGKIAGDHPLRREARLFMLCMEYNRTAYITAIKSTYRAHPTERDTFAQSARFVDALRPALARHGIDIDARAPRAA